MPETRAGDRSWSSNFYSSRHRVFHVASQPLAYGPLEEQPPLPPRVRRLDNLRLDSSDVPAWQGEALPIRF